MCHDPARRFRRAEACSGCSPSRTAATSGRPSRIMPISSNGHQRADGERQDQMRLELHAGEDEERRGQPADAARRGDCHEPAMKEAGGAVGHRQKTYGRRIGRQQQMRDQRRAERHERRGDIGQEEGAHWSGRGRGEDRDQRNRNQGKSAESEQIDQRTVERASEPRSEAGLDSGQAVEVAPREAPAHEMTAGKASAKGGEQTTNQSNGIGPFGDAMERPMISAGAMSAPCASSAVPSRRSSVRRSSATR